MIKYMIPVPLVRSLYCPVEKVGSTFWQRFIYMIQKSSPRKRKYSHPFEVDINLALVHRPKPLYQAKPSDFKNDFKFMFVRDPYKRIASAFVDKLLAPNPLFWNLFGRLAIERFRGVDKNRKCFHDVTFSEFVQFVVWAEKSRRELDAHFQVATEVCVPCTMKYDFIGKYKIF
ncbi:hypothetical protein DPMN_079837 [Dreissena polymorpha]|uniref:Carbohydrate sulfotransferase n=1 Tax=Dreissena polymorpha TaxID=45954 RepID=A0A9D4BRH4_DREPO|nr:hypothetical protein DPMN_079837 [Dreissena polymorpha]